MTDKDPGQDQKPQDALLSLPVKQEAVRQFFTEVDGFYEQLEQQGRTVSTLGGKKVRKYPASVTKSGLIVEFNVMEDPYDPSKDPAVPPDEWFSSSVKEEQERARYNTGIIAIIQDLKSEDVNPILLKCTDDINREGLITAHAMSGAHLLPEAFVRKVTLMQDVYRYGGRVWMYGTDERWKKQEAEGVDVFFDMLPDRPNQDASEDEKEAYATAIQTAREHMREQGFHIFNFSLVTRQSDEGKIIRDHIELGDEQLERLSDVRQRVGFELN